MFSITIDLWTQQSAPLSVGQDADDVIRVDVYVGILLLTEIILLFLGRILDLMRASHSLVHMEYRLEKIK